MKKMLQIATIISISMGSQTGHGQQDGSESAHKSEAENEPTVMPREKSLAEKYKERKRRGGFTFSPGIYRSNDAKVNGFEFSFLYNGYGPVIGFEDKFKYAEIEFASLLLALGVGVRKTNEKEGREKSGDATQVTASIPFSPLFPYGRWIFGDPDKDKEFGLMLKLPITWSAGAKRHQQDD